MANAFTEQPPAEFTAAVQDIINRWNQTVGSVGDGVKNFEEARKPFDAEMDALLKEYGYDYGSRLDDGSHNSNYLNLGPWTYDAAVASGTSGAAPGTFGVDRAEDTSSFFSSPVLGIIATALAPVTGGWSVAALKALEAADGVTLTTGDYLQAAAAVVGNSELFNQTLADAGVNTGELPSMIDDPTYATGNAALDAVMNDPRVIVNFDNIAATVPGYVPSPLVEAARSTFTGLLGGAFEGDSQPDPVIVPGGEIPGINTDHYTPPPIPPVIDEGGGGGATDATPVQTQVQPEVTQWQPPAELQPETSQEDWAILKELIDAGYTPEQIQELSQGGQPASAQTPTATQAPTGGEEQTFDLGSGLLSGPVDTLKNTPEIDAAGTDIVYAEFLSPEDPNNLYQFIPGDYDPNEPLDAHRAMRAEQHAGNYMGMASTLANEHQVDPYINDGHGDAYFLKDVTNGIAHYVSPGSGRVQKLITDEQNPDLPTWSQHLSAAPTTFFNTPSPAPSPAPDPGVDFGPTPSTGGTGTGTGTGTGSGSGTGTGSGDGSGTGDGDGSGNTSPDFDFPIPIPVPVPSPDPAPNVPLWDTLQGGWESNIQRPDYGQVQQQGLLTAPSGGLQAPMVIPAPNSQQATWEQWKEAMGPEQIEQIEQGLLGSIAQKQTNGLL